jgi:hypothetical protein
MYSSYFQQCENSGNRWGLDVAADRFLSAQFCDDVRNEVGNKYSLIGCYSGGLQIKPIPSVIPKICVVIKAYTPKERPFTKLVFRVFRDETAVAEMALPIEQYPNAGIQAEAQMQLFLAVIILSPFAVDAPCVMRVEAECEDEIMYGGRLWISESPSEAGTSAT